MTELKDRDMCCDKSSRLLENFKVEAIVTVDNRGQIVIPKDVRMKLGITTGDKLTMVSSQKDSKTCCIYLFKTEELTSTIRRLLGPMLEEVNKE